MKQQLLLTFGVLTAALCVAIAISAIGYAAMILFP